MEGILAALQFLTVARRYSRAAIKPTEIAAGVFYFPLIGLALGLILATINYFLERYLESEILGTVDVMVLIIMTGAVHLEQLRKSFDLLSNRSQVRPTPEPPFGIFGLLAVLFVVLLKIRAIEVIGETRLLTLIVVPILARWAPMMLLYEGSAAGSGRIGEQLKSWQFILITAMTLSTAGYFLGVAGLWAGFCLSLLALAVRLYVAPGSAGFDQNAVGALIELGESVSFVLFASV
jgi:adenosylcobinamide-GDP ribazoletransferase